MIPRCEESVTLLFGGLSIHFFRDQQRDAGMPSDLQRVSNSRGMRSSGVCQMVGSFLQKEITGTSNELLELKLNREIRPTSAVGPH